MLVTGDSQRNSLVARKRAQWAEENDPQQDRYMTQGKATIDATANYVKDHKPPGAVCAKKHAVTSGQLNSTYRNTGLRTGVELKCTPLDKR